MDRSGDFPYYVDALTLGGMPSLFSSYRLHRETKTQPFVVLENPAPLFLSDKPSFDLLCNFNLQQYLDDSPGLEDWMRGAGHKAILKVTYLLLDLMVTYVAAFLARYYTPAWAGVLQASRDDIYNDVRHSYTVVAEDLPLYFTDQYPFAYSYDTR
jgi:hypothetical protein